MKYIFFILVTYCYADSYTAENTESLESSGEEGWKNPTNGNTDQWGKRISPAGNNTFQNLSNPSNDFDGVIPVVFASEKEKKFKIKKFIVKIDPSDPLYKKIKLIRLVFILHSRSGLCGRQRTIPDDP